MARRKAKTYGSAILLDHGGRLSARHMRLSLCATDIALKVREAR
jgi:hypothetical protein